MLDDFIIVYFLVCQSFLQKVKEVVLNIKFFYLVTGKVYHCTLSLATRIPNPRSKEATTKIPQRYINIAKQNSCKVNLLKVMKQILHFINVHDA